MRLEKGYLCIMKSNKQKIYYHRAGEAFSCHDFASQLKELIHTYEQQNGRQQIQFLCIGSDRVAGDSLGPIIGYKLNKRFYRQTNNYQVHGSLKNPVHALNLPLTLRRMEQSALPTLVIAIDASLGARDHIGCITLSNRPLRPGLGLDKDLPAVGAISITGIVASEESASCLCLQNTSLALVMELADCICNGITDALLPQKMVQGL